MSLRVGIKRVARLMNGAGLTGRWSGKAWRPRAAQDHPPVAETLVVSVSPRGPESDLGGGPHLHLAPSWLALPHRNH